MGQTAQEQAKLPVPPQEELNKKFSEMLSGATLVGVYTLDGAPEGQAPKPDKYTLDKVTKLPEADLWQFEATVAVGGRGMSMPIVVAVKWAGDTPMIQLTSTAIEGMGTYSTRIFFYEDQYAGTWKHGAASGLMHGRIVKEAKPATPTDK